MTVKNKRVLLAEHEKNIKDILIYLLKSWDYEVIIAADGLSVFDIIKREHPDIVIIDSNLPKLDGLKVSKALKEDFLTAHIPVIILIDKKQIRKKMLEIEQGVDDYITNPPDPIDLEVRLEMAMRRTSHQLHANALTKLPGNRQIERIIRSKLDGKEIFSLAYYDIDNFKSFNDKYGYLRGDAVIRHMAYIVSMTVKRFGNKDDFVGHVGGDDFVVITSPERDRLIASESILTFSRLAPFHYSKDDRERGFIVAKDRKGNITNTPLMSVSIAIVNNKEHAIENIVELMETVAEIKHYLKTLPGSNFLINRRKSAKKEFIHPGPDSVSRKAGKHEAKLKYRPLGQILVESHIITSQQLDVALSRHWSTGQRIGQSVIDLGMASLGDISRALEMQLNVPHFEIKNLDRTGELKECIHKIPFDLMETSRIIPVNKEKDVVSLAMLNPKDINAIDRIKTVTGCRVAPFFVFESEFSEILGRVKKIADKGV